MQNAVKDTHTSAYAYARTYTHRHSLTVAHTHTNTYTCTRVGHAHTATGKFCDTYEKIILSIQPKIMNFYCQLHCTQLTPVRPAEALSWQLLFGNAFVLNQININFLLRVLPLCATSFFWYCVTEVFQKFNSCFLLIHYGHTKSTNNQVNWSHHLHKIA